MLWPKGIGATAVAVLSVALVYYLLSHHPHSRPTTTMAGLIVICAVVVLYLAFQRPPEDAVGTFIAVVRAIQEKLANDAQEPGPEEFVPVEVDESDASGQSWLELHGDELRPVLVRPGAKASPPPGSNPVATPVESLGLEILYGIIEETRVRYLTRDQLPLLSLPPRALHARCLDNLRRNPPFEAFLSVTPAGQIAMCSFQDGSDASRLLLLPEHLPPASAFLAAVPHRRGSLFCVMISEDRDLREMLKAHHPPDSDRLLLGPFVRVTRDGFELLPSG